VGQVFIRYGELRSIRGSNQILSCYNSHPKFGSGPVRHFVVVGEDEACFALWELCCVLTTFQNVIIRFKARLLSFQEQIRGLLCYFYRLPSLDLVRMRLQDHRLLFQKIKRNSLGVVCLRAVENGRSLLMVKDILVGHWKIALLLVILQPSFLFLACLPANFDPSDGSHPAVSFE